MTEIAKIDVPVIMINTLELVCCSVMLCCWTIGVLQNSSQSWSNVPSSVLYCCVCSAYMLAATRKDIQALKLFSNKICYLGALANTGWLVWWPQNNSVHSLLNNNTHLTAFFQDNLGKSVSEEETILGFAKPRDDGKAVASAGLYASHLHLAAGI